MSYTIVQTTVHCKRNLNYSVEIAAVTLRCRSNQYSRVRKDRNAFLAKEKSCFKEIAAHTPLAEIVEQMHQRKAEITNL